MQFEFQSLQFSGNFTPAPCLCTITLSHLALSEQNLSIFLTVNIFQTETTEKLYRDSLLFGIIIFASLCIYQRTLSKHLK